MSKNIIAEKNISRAFSTLKDYQKTKIVKAISEYLSINVRNANKAFDSCLKCGVENCLDSGILAGKLHFATRALQKVHNLTLGYCRTIEYHIGVRRC